MSLEDHREPAGRIEIPGDILIPDSEFCALVLGGATPRPASKRKGYPLPWWRGANIALSMRAAPGSPRAFSAAGNERNSGAGRGDKGG